ncbi:MAG TPA: carbohydrate ABC transporter permease [Candidatus Rifleibacterium sp.]|nr:carbohydrate ABC transporter permease [Candidatus Rifleibacterium sp.]HPT47026.1 carbohydrate ABC transporter permease [Candidatus Rifleibacterium sp.]
MSRKFANQLSLLMLSFGLILTGGPLVWMLITAFTSPDALSASPPRYGEFSLENFKVLLNAGNILRWSINSFLVSAAVTLAQTIFNALAAFGFAAGRFKGREAIFMVLLAAMMVPGQIVMLPLFLFMAKWGMIDSLWSVILPAIASPFGVYMVRQYMDSIPIQMSEAAQIDGASQYQVFRHIYFPLSMPILATSGIFTFITQWNAFLWPLITLNSERYYTLTVGLSTLQDQQMMDFGLLMAGATLAAVPMVIVFMFFSRYMLEGMRKGALQ